MGPPKVSGDPGALRYEQAMTERMIADPSLRWHDPDQVQRVRLAPSQPVTGHPSEEPVIRYLLFDYNARAGAAIGSFSAVRDDFSGTGGGIFAL
ncbi:hypothetical protein ADP72_20200 [Serratia plymuthica]|nr:hypothetical protein ADP72_20200 [Serratia plymuthica]